jgi:hypothetical protein
MILGRAAQNRLDEGVNAGERRFIMWMSNVYIVVNQNNWDRNSLCDLCAAVAHAGATVVAVDEHSHVIEAATPAQEVPIIAAMEGVAYVRCSFSYVVNTLPRLVA